jgi:hypothetical protein
VVGGRRIRDHADVTHDGRSTGARIAEAIDKLRDACIPVRESTQAGATTYLMERPTYRAEVIVNPARWLGLQFDLLGQDQSALLKSGVDTDVYNISLPKYRWFAEEIEADIVIFLEGLAQGEILVNTASRRASMIVPSGEGPMVGPGKRRYRHLARATAPSSEPTMS